MSRVFVTGASSGIGQAAAQQLAADGHQVFAAVRRPDDAEALAGDGAVPVTLEVTSDESVRAAFAEVAEHLSGAPLDAVVLNAGVAWAGPLACQRPDEVLAQLDINAVGALRVTQAALPLMTGAERPRIVVVTSAAVSIATPFMASYAASKGALSILADGLRRELPAPFRVVVVEPGPTKTPMWERGRRAAAERTAQYSAEAYAPYADPAADFERSTHASEANGVSAGRVAERVVFAATDRRTPRTHYRVGREARLAHLVRWLLPAWLVDRLVGLDRDRPVAGHS